MAADVLFLGIPLLYGTTLAYNELVSLDFTSMMKVLGKPKCAESFCVGWLCVYTYEDPGDQDRKHQINIFLGTSHLNLIAFRVGPEIYQNSSQVQINWTVRSDCPRLALIGRESAARVISTSLKSLPNSKVPRSLPCLALRCGQSVLPEDWNILFGPRLVEMKPDKPLLRM